MYIAKGNVSGKGYAFKTGEEVPKEIALRIINLVTEVPDKMKDEMTESAIETMGDSIEKHIEKKIMTAKDIKKKTIKKQ